MAETGHKSESAFPINNEMPCQNGSVLEAFNHFGRLGGVINSDVSQGEVRGGTVSTVHEEL